MLQAGQVGSNVIDHGGVVEPPKSVRRDHYATPGLPEDEFEFVVSVDRNDRVAHCSDTDRREMDDVGLEPVRKLPRDDVSFDHAKVAESARQSLYLREHLGIGQRDRSVDKGG